MVAENTPRAPLTRTSITATAKELFSTQGYGNTTIEDIAKRLGVRKGAIYYHVPRKADVLIEVVAELLRPIAQRVEQIVASDTAPSRQLADAVTNHVDQLLANQQAARVFFEQIDDVPAEHAELADLSARIEGAFDRILAAGISLGQFRPSPVPLMRMHVLALCNWPYRWFDPGGNYSRSQIADSVWQHVAALVLTDPISPNSKEKA